jgi:UDP-N-acetylglucosamine 1-carboxyvinyltransferase
MAKLIINGGKPLNGTVTPVANKNSIIKLIPACILTDKPVVIHNIPMSSSVRLFIQVFKQLGGQVTYLDNKSIKLDASTINTHIIDEELAEKERATFVFLGPLLARFGKAEISDPGGCKLGNRPLDTLFQGMKAMGVNVDKSNGYKLYTDGLKGNENIWLMEASVTGTENLVLAAVKAKGKTVIYNAACEPHTQDLCNFLVSLGAKIEGIGTNRLTIEGVEELSGGEWSVISDHIDIGGWIVAAAITGGEITIENAIPEHMMQVLNNFEKLNLQYEVRGSSIFIPGNQTLECKLNIRGDIDKIVSETWPGYPVDLIPQGLVLAASAKGNIKIHSYMYETQLFFVEELQRLRASLIMADPHRVITFGPAKFKGAKITAPNILQCVHAVLLAGLAADGTTTIENADMIFRRYPEIIETLQTLGADVQMEE